MKATNSGGVSGYATTADISTPSIPAAPSNFNATASADGRSVTVAWTDNAANESGYSGNYCPGGSPAGCTAWQNVGAYPPNTTSYTKTGLTPGSTNMFEVHAYNDVGESTHVGHIDVTQPNYPSVPSIVSATSGADGTTTTVSWNDVATETAYFLERCTGTGCTTGFIVVGNNLPANNTSFGDSGLSSGNTYGYRLRAYNLVGYSGYSGITYLTPMTAPPAAPSGLTVTSAPNGLSVLLNWIDNASNETGYKLQRCTGVGCTPGDYLSLPTNTVSQTDSSTQPTIVYGYAVCAVNNGGAACSGVTYLTTSAVHYYISDQLGSTALVVSSSGVIEEEEMYFPYGGERWHNGANANHYKFTGKERDTETGLDYFGARYYRSNIGRFFTPDESAGGPVSVFGEDPTPFGPLPYADISNPQSLNKYTYTYNNPIRYVDPNGHCVSGTLDTLICLGAGIAVAKIVQKVWDFDTNLHELVNLRENLKAAVDFALKSCGNGGSNCDQAVQTAAEAEVNLYERAKSTLGGALTLPGTFLGGPLPSSKGDLAGSTLSDAITEMAIKLAEQRREAQARAAEKKKSEEDRKKIEEERRRREEEQKRHLPLPGAESVRRNALKAIFNGTIYQKLEYQV